MNEKILFVYLFGHMNEFYIASQRHKIIVWMIFSTLIDEHDVNQGDIHESVKCTNEKSKQKQINCTRCC